MGISSRRLDKVPPRGTIGKWILYIVWDPVKAESNLEKHGVSFEEAATVIQAEMTITIEDSASVGEQRFVTIGISVKLRVILVVHTHWDDMAVRIISARKATKKEQSIYEKRVRF
jgi:uncharacterized DUF497 family protein